MKISLVPLLCFHLMKCVSVYVAMLTNNGLCINIDNSFGVETSRTT